MKKEKTVRTYQRRTKSGKMVTVREHKASYDAAEEARKAAAKKAGAGSELSKKKAVKEESPLGFSADDYKEWYHWDMEDDANNEAALRVEKALIKKMGKRAYNKYLEDMSNSYTARGHKKAHQALLDEHTAQQKKQDVESAKTAKDIARSAKDSSESSSAKTRSIPRRERGNLLSAEQVERLRKNGWVDAHLGKNGVLSYATKDGGREEASTHFSLADIDYLFREGASKSSTTPKNKAKDSDLVEHYDQFNKKYIGKAVGDSFTFSEGRGKDKVTYDARFVTDGRGRYGYVVRDKAEGPDAKYYVGVGDEGSHSQLPAGLRKAAEAQGLRFKGGEFVKNVGASSKSTGTSSTKTEKAEPKGKKLNAKETSDPMAEKRAKWAKAQTEATKMFNKYVAKNGYPGDGKPAMTVLGKFLRQTLKKHGWDTDANIEKKVKSYLY